MFYWKNALILIVLLGVAMLPAFQVARGNKERGFVVRLAWAAAAIVLVAMSALPLSLSLLAYALILMLTSNAWLPLSAVWLYFVIWTPAAGIYFGVGGLYFGVIGPALMFALALLLLYLTSPAHHGRRGIDSSDVWLLIFLTSFCICASLRGPWTGVPRLLVNFLLAFGISYQILSRARIRNAELVLRLFIVAVAAASLLCLFEALWAWPLYSVLSIVKTGMLDSVPKIMLFRGGIVRAYGPFSHPLAGSAVCGMAGVAFFAFLQMRRASLPIMALGVMIALGLVATVSRTGILAFTVGVAVFALLRGRQIIAFLMAAAGLTMLLVLPILLKTDLQESATYRFALMTEVPRLLGSNIWLGYREALDNGVLESLKQGQGIVDLVNIYVGIIVFAGVLSLVPYVIFLATTVTRYRELRRAGPNEDQLLLGQACVAMQAGFLAMAPFIGAWSSPMLLSCTWIAILAALRAEVARMPAGVRSQSASPLIDPSVSEPLPMLR